MTLKVFFKPRTGKFPLRKFRAYFKKRAYVTCKANQARYEHPQTNVRFSFEHIAGGLSPQNFCDPPEVGVVYFHISTPRASVFGREAEPEVTALAQAFDLVLLTGRKRTPTLEYTPERFLNLWDSANERAYAKLARRKEPGVYRTFPQKEIERIWRWNRDMAGWFVKPGRRRRGQELFPLTRVYAEVNAPNGRIPKDFPAQKISFFRTKRRAFTFTPWIEGWPAILPKVDLLFVQWWENAPGASSNIDDHSLHILDWADAAPVLRKFSKPCEGLCLFPTYGWDLPAKITEMIGAKGRRHKTYEFTGFDRILDAELMRKWRRKRKAGRKAAKTGAKK